MPEQSTQQRVIELIADELLIDDESTITPETKLDTLGDSLDMAEMVFRIEEEFGVELSDEQFERITTVGELAAYVESQEE